MEFVTQSVSQPVSQLTRLIVSVVYNT